MREGRHAVCRLLFALLLGAALARPASAGHLFVEEPILRFSPAKGDSPLDLFGYSVTAHSLSEGLDFDEAVADARIIVGAPNGTFPGGLSSLESLVNGTLNNTGLVYQCPISPGACTELMGSGEGNDIRMFDFEGNGENEMKSEQFMGASIVSSGDHFLACAPRWISLLPFNQYGEIDRTRSHGRCFISTRNLTNFQLLRPCTGGSVATQGGESFCMAGTGAAMLEDGGTTSVLLGGPPFDDSSGAVFSYSIQNNVIPPDEELSSDQKMFWYTGLSVTHGRILSTDTQDYVYSLPKINNYRGAVQVRNASTLSVGGQQMGEYFGWSVATADLNGDNFDEVLVGAPLYSTTDLIERGRVFVYENTQGNLSDTPIIITGNAEKARFGSDIVNLGDINSDGYDDVAIGAPFEYGGPNAEGAVYVYYGAGENVIETEPSETFTASLIMETVEGVNELKSFGYSLSSGSDIDGNEYNDLVIGSYKSQAVTVLRTKSIANISMSATTDVDELDFDIKDCMFQGYSYPCFNITVNASYSGRGMNGRPLRTIITIEEDVTADSEDRLFFLDEMGNTITTYTGDFIFPSTDEEVEQNIRTYVKNDTTERRRNIFFTVAMTGVEIEERNVTGNQALTDLRDTPILNVMPEDVIEVELPLAGCGPDRICMPDLVLELLSVRYLDDQNRDRGELLAGSVEQMELVLQYYTKDENAINSLLRFNLPSDIFSSSFTIESTKLDVPTPQCTNYTCRLPDFFTESDGTLQATIKIPVVSLIGSEMNTTAQVTIQDENADDPIPENNTVSIPLSVVARATVTLDMRMSPDKSTYNPGQDIPSNPAYNELGARVTVRTTVRNNGPSTIPNSQLTVYIPGQDENTGDYYYIYPGSAQNDSTSSIEDVRCTGANPDNLLEREGLMGKRKRRNVPILERLRRVKHGVPEKRSLKKRAVDRTVDCSADQAVCTPIICTIKNFGVDMLTIDIVSYVDGRFFSSQSGDFQLISYAFFEVEDFFVDSPDQSATSEYLVEEQEDEADETVPIWVYIVSIIGALIVLVLIIVLLYLVGFFRLKRRKERLEKERASTGVTATTTGPAAKETPNDADLDSKPEKSEEGEPTSLDEKPSGADEPDEPEEPDETEL